MNTVDMKCRTRSTQCSFGLGRLNWNQVAKQVSMKPVHGL